MTGLNAYSWLTYSVTDLLNEEIEIEGPGLSRTSGKDIYIGHPTRAWFFVLPCSAPISHRLLKAETLTFFLGGEHEQ
jgi:hypothetical protein